MNRHNFIFEFASRLRRGCLLLTGQSQCVLHVAGDAVGFGHVFCRDAHVILVIHIPQAINDHAVDHFPIAHALTIARVVQNMGRGTHVFLATGDDDFAVAPGHGLSGQHDRFETRPTHRIDGQCRYLLWDTCLHQGLASWVLPGTRSQHLAHDDLTHQRWIQTRTGQHFTNHQAAQLGGAEFGQTAPKFANARPGGRNNHDVLQNNLLKNG